MKTVRRKAFPVLAALVIALCAFLPLFGVSAETAEPTVEPSVEISVEASVEPTVEETVAPTVEPSVEPSVSPSVEEEKPTIGGHVTAWIEKYWGEAVAALSAFFVGAFYAFALPWLKRKLKKIVTSANKNEETTALVVGAINQMIEKLEQIEEAHNKKDAEQDAVAITVTDDVAKLKVEVEEVKEFAYACLNILKTVYANSKNVPQGVKDLVNLKYAKAISAATHLNITSEETSNEKQNEI